MNKHHCSPRTRPDHFIRIRRKRPALRIIVSSATLDASSFLEYFTSTTMSSEEAAIVSLEGRMYPVEVAYLCEPSPDYVRKAAEVAWNIHLQVCTGFFCYDGYRLKRG